MSDIHGQYKAFIKMLEKIQFKETDVLYILGDIIDRGPEVIELYNYIKSKDNIHLLMGNHEKMMSDYFILGSKRSFYLWIENGGDATYEQLKSYDTKFTDEMAEFFYNLPYYQIIEHDGQKYILCHAGMYYSPEKTFDENIDHNLFTDYFVWLRDNPYLHTPDDHIIIHGHTPVQYQFGEDEITTYANGKVINVDCGCAGEYRLGCLRLDDKQEFYVDIKNKNSNI